MARVPIPGPRPFAVSAARFERRECVVMNSEKQRRLQVRLTTLLAGGLLFGALAPLALSQVAIADGEPPNAEDRRGPTDRERGNRPSVRLSLDSARVVMAGQFLPGTEPQEVNFPTAATGRYFCLETLSAQDGRPYAAVAELDFLDPAGRLLPRGNWRIAYVDSEELDRENGLAERAIDGDPASYWHSQWGGASPAHPHHLVLDLGRSQTIAGFRYTPRPGSGIVGGLVEGYRIYVGNDLVNEPAQNKTLPEKCYVFCYFVRNGEDGLHLACSLNGYRWNPIYHSRSFLKSEVATPSLMRDPCLLRGPDGTFHLVWTASWTGNFIGYASSRDLIHWSNQRALPRFRARTELQQVGTHHVHQVDLGARPLGHGGGELFVGRRHLDVVLLEQRQELLEVVCPVADVGVERDVVDVVLQVVEHRAVPPHPVPTGAEIARPRRDQLHSHPLGYTTD